MTIRATASPPSLSGLGTRELIRGPDMLGARCLLEKGGLVVARAMSSVIG